MTKETLLYNAIENVRSLDAVGITESFVESATRIFATLGLPCPDVIPRRNALASLPAEKPSFRPVKREAPTERLQRALDELVELDEPIYEAALGMFNEQRLTLPT